MTAKKKKTPSALSARPGRLTGKVALVTGAAGNIGEVIVRRYLEEGARVVMVGRNRDKLEVARQALLQQTGAPEENALALAFDAADPGQARHGMESAIRHYGRLDVLVNNAGSAGPKAPIENLPLAREELEALRAAGSTDTETVADAAGNPRRFSRAPNILAVPPTWYQKPRSMHSRSSLPCNSVSVAFG